MEEDIDSAFEGIIMSEER